MVNELPALEDILTAEEIADTKKKISDLAVESYQSILDKVVEMAGFSGMDAELTMDIELSLYMNAAGNPEIGNQMTAGIKFTPEVTHDFHEMAKREIVSHMFARVIKR